MTVSKSGRKKRKIPWIDRCGRRSEGKRHRCYANNSVTLHKYRKLTVPLASSPTKSMLIFIERDYFDLPPLLLP